MPLFEAFIAAAFLSVSLFLGFRSGFSDRCTRVHGVGVLGGDIPWVRPSLALRASILALIPPTERREGIILCLSDWSRSEGPFQCQFFQIHLVVLLCCLRPFFKGAGIVDFQTFVG